MSNGIPRPDHDPAEDFENERERTGDLALATQDFSNEDAGYHKTLKPRQIQMIAIGGQLAPDCSWEPVAASMDRGRR